jgi:hypothetical protein
MQHIGEAAYCACLTVQYEPIEIQPGRMRECWRCASCKREFIPVAYAIDRPCEVSEAQKRITQQYQDLVYAVCNLVDGARGDHGTARCTIKDVVPRLKGLLDRPREVTEDLEDFFCRVAEELLIAQRKWPNNDMLHRLAALSGEVGELAEGYLKGRAHGELRTEAVQVAAMAYRAALAVAEGATR